jgi:type IV protein arginine methyltransferase
MAFESSIDIDTQRLLLAASNHDIPTLRDLLKVVPATVQDPETGFSAIHAAIAACELEESAVTANGTDGMHEATQNDLDNVDMETAAEIVRFLLQNGAIWNDLDSNNETPGCIARRLGLDGIYHIIVDAGVRAELLLNRLDEYAQLEDEDDDEQGDDETEPDHASTRDDSPHPLEHDDVSRDNSTYLANELLVDASRNAIMMEWERPLMATHSRLLLPNDGLRVLNIGHGLGIIDELFQFRSPSTHHIIEAHPDVLARMKEQGWYEKPGVVVHEGDWRDVLPKLVSRSENEEYIAFDAIFFDTFAGEYKALKQFFSEWVVQLLDSDGRFAFFNGMGADRQVCYDVYNKVCLYYI